MIAALMVLLAASPCGGDSDSDSDSDSGDSYSSSDDDGDSDSEPACVEVSDVVGREVCSRFGSWDAGWRPRLQFSMGTSGHQIPLGRMSFSGAASHETNVGYKIVGNEPGVARAGSLDIRITGNLHQHVYLGYEGSVGGADIDGVTPLATEGQMIDTRNGLYLTSGAVAGVSAIAGDYTLRAEAFAGWRGLGVSVRSQHEDCITTSTAFHHELLFEPRVAVERWLTPWVSMGAMAGSNPFRSGDFSAGVFFSWHARAFDAARSR